MNVEFWHLALGILSPVISGLAVFLISRYFTDRRKAHQDLIDGLAEVRGDLQKVKTRISRCPCADEKLGD